MTLRYAYSTHYLKVKVVECCNTMVNLAKKGIRAPKIMHQRKGRVSEGTWWLNKKLYIQRNSILGLLEIVRLNLKS